MLELSCRVRPLSESLNDLFREVSLLRKRVTELSHRLETLEPFLSHYGYRGTKEGAAGEGVHGGEEVVAAGYQSPRPGAKGSRVVGRRRVRVLRKGGVRLLQRVRDSQWTRGWKSLRWWYVAPLTRVCLLIFYFSMINSLRQSYFQSSQCQNRHCRNCMQLKKIKCLWCHKGSLHQPWPGFLFHSLVIFHTPERSGKGSVLAEI